MTSSAPESSIAFSMSCDSVTVVTSHLVEFLVQISLLYIPLIYGLCALYIYSKYYELFIRVIILCDVIHYSSLYVSCDIVTVTVWPACNIIFPSFTKPKNKEKIERNRNKNIRKI